jgi:hypothetical protein
MHPILRRTLPLVVLFTAAAAPAAETNRTDWSSYRTILWMADRCYADPARVPLVFQRLRDLGANTAMAGGGQDAQAIVAQGFPYYVENIIGRGLCLKWNSGVRDWDAFVTRWRNEGRPAQAFVREYGLDDPAWQVSARRQMEDAVRRHAPNHPLAYDIRDELSVTISANPFDYDFAPSSLAGFRQWLRASYADLASLNAAWETDFAAWDAVVPFSTDRIKNRMAGGGALPRGQPDWQALQRVVFVPETARRTPTAWNFAPWCDFRTYMDVVLARTLGDLRHAAHAIDPVTPVGIEGTQMPSAFGGYDLARLADVLDWVEPYDIGGARAIWGAFMPGRPIVSTIGEADAAKARRRLWHLLLEGDRGCIVWWSEDCIDWTRPDLPLTAKGQALAPVLRELTGPVADLFVRATRAAPSVFFLYSQPSIQVDWLLESTPDGATWQRRFSSYEARHNRQARDRVALLAAVRRAGLDATFARAVPTTAAKAGDVLILSQALALSDADVAALRTFPGRIAFDIVPGDFDEHGRLRAANPFTPTPAAWQRVAADGTGSWSSSLQPVLAAVGREVRLRPVAGVGPATAIRVCRLGEAMLVGIECDAGGEMGEDLKIHDGPAVAITEFEAALDAPGYVYDLWSLRDLGRTDRIRFALDPARPALFAVLRHQVPSDRLIATLQTGTWADGRR